jgi:hypothetical protein
MLLIDEDMSLDFVLQQKHRIRHLALELVPRSPQMCINTTAEDIVVNYREFFKKRLTLENKYDRNDLAASNLITRFDLGSSIPSSMIEVPINKLASRYLNLRRLSSRFLCSISASLESFP